jgi:hypothetical protein
MAYLNNIIFEHAEIDGVLSDIIPFENFMLNWFPQVHLSPYKHFYFDQVYQDDRVSPFVNPRETAELSKSRGFDVKAYTPGYIKDKAQVEPDHVFNRRAGEAMAAPMSNDERYRATIVDIAARLKDRYMRNLEIQACQLLMNGSYTMKGSGITETVDLMRNPANTVVLTGSATWNTVNSGNFDPFDSIETWINQSILPIETMIIGANAWKFLKSSPKFEKMVYINALRGTSGLEFGVQQKRINGVTYRGQLMGNMMDIYTFQKTYTDPVTGTATSYLSSDSILLLPSTQYGWQGFGPIQDSAAGFAPMPYFFKNWVETGDPDGTFVMLQAAPMLFHSKINNTLGILTGATGA